MYLDRIATARGASRACSASASPPSCSPARRTRENRRHRSDQRAAQSNRTQHPRPESNRRYRFHPDRQRSPYPLLLRVARGGRRCGRSGVAVSHLVGLVREGGGGSWRGLPRRRSRVGKRGGGGGENPKKRCGGRAEGERERGGKASEDADGWMDNTGG
jgi:hypothetical protein